MDYERDGADVKQQYLIDSQEPLERLGMQVKACRLVDSSVSELCFVMP